MAVDVSIDGISKYLKEITDGTHYTYCIIEVKSPYNVVGISTGTPLVNKQCTLNYEPGNEKCTFYPVTISELGNSGKIEDMMLRKAHEELDHSGPSIKASIHEIEDQLTSRLWVVMSEPYEIHGKNINWRILSIWPLEETGEDALTKGEAEFSIVIALALIGFILCLTLFVLLYKRRKERAVILADFQLTSAFVIGCALINLSYLCFLGERTDVSCNIAMWIPSMLAFTTLPIMIVKIYRLYALVGASSKAAKSSKFNNRQVTTF